LVVKVISGSGNTGWLDAWVWDDDAEAYVPNADFAPTWTTGKYGYGLDFDPSYDEERGGVTPYSRPMVFVETHGSESDDGTLNLTGSFTTALWLWHDGDGLGGARCPSYPTLLAKPGAFLMQAPKDAGVDYWLYDNPGEPGLEVGLDADSALPIEEWVHVAFTFDVDAGTPTLYINGVAQAAAPEWDSDTRSYPSTAYDLFIGHYPWESPVGDYWYREFSGKIDDVALFDGALSPEDVAKVMAGNFEPWILKKITCNVTPGFVVPGIRVELTASEGSDYVWVKDDTITIEDDPPRVTGANSKTLVFDPVELGDSGTYVCHYNNGAKETVQTEPYELEVLDTTLPATGICALAGLIAALGLGGAHRIARRR